VVTDPLTVGDDITVMVTDGDLNTNSGVAETLVINVTNDNGESEAVTLTETGVDTGIFTGTVSTTASATAGADNSGNMNVTPGDVVTVTYNDSFDANGNDPAAVTDTVTVAAAELDSDGDLIPDSTDPDDDNDGVLDVDEQVGDTDGDGKDDRVDSDDDGDGVATKDEGATTDTDGDSVKNYLDTDDDGDGVATKDEGATTDTDGDSVKNYLDTDDDGDGIATKDEGAVIDTDGDSVKNYLDEDDDGDGVPTIDEGTITDTDGDTVPNYLDTDDDGDGVATKDENAQTDDNNPTNDDTDGDSVPNYLDEDDDNDGVLTINEDTSLDTDGDGTPDHIDINDNESLLELDQLFTPNGDGENESFKIPNIQVLYPNYEMVVFNRYGSEVFRYQHNGDTAKEPTWWTGESDNKVDYLPGEKLPVGTYFYVIYKNKGNQKPVQGWIYLNR
ncbi:gliding motility-associated C-terminal domain-containing protein, partial [Flavobacteriaceae bacterium]|nr:gliding motility-associated C-terminal domain-containing protein [Flavobacteriaceae bacterium]